MTELTAEGNSVLELSTKLMMRELQVAKAAIASNPQATRRHLDNLIILLAKQNTEDKCDRGSKLPNGYALAPWQAKRISAFIEANLDRAIPIQELAAIARLSVSYFFRAFRGSFGTAPHSYIVERRIERAERRLRESGMPLAEVALDCGFADQAHFSRAFARHAGLPPGAWRRMNQILAKDDFNCAA